MLFLNTQVSAGLLLAVRHLLFQAVVFACPFSLFLQIVSTIAIKEVIRGLPELPGIYKYFDKEGTILYIGKAKNLKKRVSSYFNKREHENRKTTILVSKIATIEFTIVDTEYDALLLENSLIKEFQPRYNVNLKDDKSYPFIKITNEPFPKILVIRNPIKDGSEYFGPYSTVPMMYIVVDLVKKLYPTRNCNLPLHQKSISEGKFKICLEYQIGNCLAPCVGYQSEKDYMDSVKQIKHLLRGNLAEVKRHLKECMQQSVSRLAFEEAQQYKEKLEAVEKFQAKSTVVSNVINNVDVFGICSDESAAFLNYMRIANGMVVQTQNMEYKKKLDESDYELLLMAIAEVRNRYGSDSQEVIVPFAINNNEFGLKFTVPSTGDKKKLLDLSSKNAMYFKREKLDKAEKLDPNLKTERVLQKMKEDLRLQDLPRYIECFDNSNIQGAFPVSACVVFKDTKPSKVDYRHFNIRTVVGPDDFASMREAIGRRYKRLVEEGLPLPDLLIVDGGKGQLSAAVETLKQVGVYGKFPVLGIAKKLEELFYPEDPIPLLIDKKSETLRVIQHIRDEAHRFGITHHRNKRSKSFAVSQLEDIEGVGEKTATSLLTHFKSVKKIKEADVDSLAKVVGLAKAALVYKFYNEQKN